MSLNCIYQNYKSVTQVLGSIQHALGGVKETAMTVYECYQRLHASWATLLVSNLLSSCMYEGTAFPVGTSI